MPKTIYHNIKTSGPFILVINKHSGKECYIPADQVASFEEAVHTTSQHDYICITLTNAEEVWLFDVFMKEVFNAILAARRFK